MKTNVVYRDFRRQTRLEQLQARDHQRRMPPGDKAWFLVGALEAFTWLCFGLYLLYTRFTFGGF